VWDAQTGAILLTLTGHTSDVFSASFSPDGSRIVTASLDRTAKVWDARTGAEVLTLKGRTNGVYSASFSPDGSRIVTAGTDGTAKVWDATPLNLEFLHEAEQLIDGKPADKKD
jgi:WD40 repeat protein